MKIEKIGQIYGLVIVLSLVLLVSSASASTVALWCFDEGSGTAVGDSSGNSINGTLNGSVNWVTGRYGTALQFNSSDDCVTMLGTSAALDFTQSFTIEAWVRYDTTGVQQYARFIRHGTQFDIYTNNPSGHRKPYAETTNVLGEKATIQEIAYMNVGVFDHYAWIYDASTNSFGMYRNGVYLSGGAGEETPFATAGTDLQTNDADIYIGNLAPGHTRYAKATFDEVRISNVALDVSELGFNGTLVPEPGTLFLLGLGGLCLMVKKTTTRGRQKA